MGLFSAMEIGKNAVIAQQRALQTVGNNIANANTPGYSRQRVEFAPIGSFRQGSFFQGLGVGINGVTRIHDRAIELRLLQANTRFGELVKRHSTLRRLETAFDALSNRALGPRISEFFNAANELSRDPTDLATRRVFLEMTGALADTFNSVRGALDDARGLVNGEIEASVADINRFSSEIAHLNQEIVRAEVGGTIQGQANDLRDKRDQILRHLSELIELRVVEQRNGSVDVITSGSFLVRGGTDFALSTTTGMDRGVPISRIGFVESGQAFEARGGALGGMLEARDELIPRYSHDLDQLARTLIQQVNEIHSGGRPLTAMTVIQSRPFSQAQAMGGVPLGVNGAVSRTGAAGGYLVDPALRAYPSSVPGGKGEFFVGARVLFTSGERSGDSAVIREYDPFSGRIVFEPPLPGIASGDKYQVTSHEFPLRHGSFELVVYNSATEVADRFNIEIDLDGLPAPPATDDTTLAELVDDINGQLRQFYGATPPVQARITSDLRLEITATAPDTSIRFERDTSGLLAASGINTLFAGHDAGSIALAERLQGRPELLAVSAGEIAGDNTNALRIAELQSTRLLASGTATLEEFYQGVIGALAVQGAEALELAENQQTIMLAIDSERTAISGVNLDEEAVALMTYQRAFQAAARYLSVVDELLGTLIQTL